jgi:hypothetical protein
MFDLDDNVFDTSPKDSQIEQNESLTKRTSFNKSLFDMDEDVSNHSQMKLNASGDSSFTRKSFTFS